MFNDTHVRLVIELIQRVELSSPRKLRTINIYMGSHFFGTTDANTASFHQPPRKNNLLLCVRRLLLLHSRFGGRSQERLGHHGRMVVRNLPLSILPDIHEGVPSLYFIAGGSHGELINSCILAPIVADSDVRPVKRS